MEVAGPELADTPGVARQLLAALAAEGVRVAYLSTTKTTVACAVERDDADRAREAVTAAFEFSGS